MVRGHAFRALDRIRSLFPSVSRTDADELAAETRERRLWPGSLLLGERGLDGHLFIVDRGAVKLCSTALDGRRFVHRIVASGEAFGWVSMLAGDDAVTEAEAIPHSIALSIPDRIVATVAARSPPVALALARWSAEEVRRCRVALEASLRDDVPSRLRPALCDLVDRFGVDTLEGSVIDLPLVQQDLAELVGSSRETVCKALSAFRKEGWIRSIDNRIVVDARAAGTWLGDRETAGAGPARSLA